LFITLLILEKLDFDPLLATCIAEHIYKTIAYGFTGIIVLVLGDIANDVAVSV